MLNQAIAKIKAAAVRLHGWWQSETSTVYGYIAVASGAITKATVLFTDKTTVTALHDLGLAEAWITHIASILIIAGSLLITPRRKGD